MKPTTRAYSYLHLAVFLWGVTAILGDLITYREYVLVWIRTGVVSLSFLFFADTFSGLKKLSKSDAMKIAGIGVIVAIHWIFFYGAIKYSNVSVALSIMATIALMTAFTEPLITKSKFQWYQALLGLLVIPGVYLIYYFSEASYSVGIVMALLSAFFAALFTSLNKKYVERTNAMTFSFVQLSGAFVFMTAFLPLYLQYFPGALYWSTAYDYSYLLILAILCTTIPYILYLNALKHLSAFTTNLANNLEPIYGIVLAIIILKENKEMDARFYIGTAIILMTIFMQPLLKNKFQK